MFQFHDRPLFDSKFQNICSLGGPSQVSPLRHSVWSLQHITSSILYPILNTNHIPSLGVRTYPPDCCGALFSWKANRRMVGVWTSPALLLHSNHLFCSSTDQDNGVPSNVQYLRNTGEICVCLSNHCWNVEWYYNCILTSWIAVLQLNLCITLMG